MNNTYLLLAIQLMTFFISFRAIAFQEKEYNPVVFNMAQLYDFNPVRGNIKELKTVVYNEDKSINYQSFLKIGRDGCVDSFTYDQKKDEYLNSVHNHLSLKKINNKLVGNDANGPVEMIVGKNCLILSRVDTNGELIYQYNDDGIIIGSQIANPRTQYSENHYNKFKLPDSIIYYKDNIVFSESIITYGKDINKPFDLTMEIKALGQPILFVISICEYNEKNIAHKCDFVLTINANGKNINLLKSSITEATFY
ncbi:YnfC family lipoprotein [Providencia rustigianii]|uniref:YnfC family lipoprotein n=1 Tax=Providencia rustigianii TaxID=158850 RepID=UPI0038B3BF9F